MKLEPVEITMKLHYTAIRFALIFGFITGAICGVCIGFIIFG